MSQVIPLGIHSWNNRMVAAMVRRVVGSRGLRQSDSEPRYGELVEAAGVDSATLELGADPQHGWRCADPLRFRVERCRNC